MSDSVVITRNVRLTVDLSAKAIYVSPSGEVTVVLRRFATNAFFPPLTVEYLEALCSKFYYGGLTHHNAIADILLLNGLLSVKHYGEFYYSLRKNLSEQRFTIISSELSL